MIQSLFRSRRADAGAEAAVSPAALAQARRLATPFIRALASAERAAPEPIPGVPGRVFQVIAPDSANAAAAVTAQLAWSSRTILGRRTLMLEHQPIDARRRRCETVRQARLPDLPWHPRLRLPADLAPTSLAEILRRARQSFDMTLIAGRDILRDPETLKVAGAADGVIFVVTAERTRSTEAREAVKAVRDAGGRPLGFVMANHVDAVPLWAGGSGAPNGRGRRGAGSTAAAAASAGAR